MKYDFDSVINRKNTCSLKWDFFESEYPMWVADMDFKVAPEIVSSIETRLKHPIFGYAIVGDEYYNAYINWWKRRHNFSMKKDELLFAQGVMPGITSLIREFTKKEDNIVIQTPVYHIFFKVIKDNNRNVLENELVYDGNNYHIDFNNLEEKLSDEKTTMMLLCNPHNPIGKIWKKEELKRIDKLCKKYDVILVSDEIHCDLTNPGNNYTALENISDDTSNIITTLAPTKTFNIAGIQGSVIHTCNKKFYERIKDRLIADNSSQINVFAIDATIAAFNDSEEWLNQLNQYVYENKKYVKNFIEKEIPNIKLIKSEATYLLWIDCTDLGIKSKEISEHLLKNAGLLVSPGLQFGLCGDNFIRLNIACPRKMLEESMQKLKEGLNSIN